jgi:hypothetical protein
VAWQDYSVARQHCFIAPTALAWQKKVISAKIYKRLLSKYWIKRIKTKNPQTCFLFGPQSALGLWIEKWERCSSLSHWMRNGGHPAGASHPWLTFCKSENLSPRDDDSTKAIRTHDPLFLFSIHYVHQDSLIYTHFSRTHLSSIHYGAHLSFYLNIFI